MWRYDKDTEVKVTNNRLFYPAQNIFLLIFMQSQIKQIKIFMLDFGLPCLILKLDNTIQWEHGQL
jgi:hypothetical protein